MKKTDDLEVEIFDWPSRFLVEAEEGDRAYEYFFPENADDPIPPHLVDLDELRDGQCDCRDFACNVLPHLGDTHCRTDCKHIIAARNFKRKFTCKPKSLPLTINQNTGPMSAPAPTEVPPSQEKPREDFPSDMT